jgi:hypothetical protein
MKPHILLTIASLLMSGKGIGIASRTANTPASARV